MDEKEEKKPEGKNPAREMMQKIRENHSEFSLHIKRIPPKAKEAFIAFANEEFLGDYGMALKWLMDGIPGQDMALALAEIDSLKERVSELETRKDEVTSSEAPKKPKTFGKRREEKYG